jgi:hypothetical protein
MRHLVVCAASVTPLCACISLLGVADVSYSDGGLAEAGGSRCDTSFVFCDGFEQGLAEWSGGDRNAYVDSVHVYRGQRAFHASLPASPLAGISAALSHEHEQPWPAPVFMRMFVYLSWPYYPVNVALLLLQKPAPSSDGLNLFLNGSPGNIDVNSNVDSSVGTTGPLHVIPTNQWVCLELEIGGTPA